MKTNWAGLSAWLPILASIAGAASPALAQTQEPSVTTPTGAVISSVAVTQAPQRAAVRVEGEGRLSVRAARMQDPERLVLDFAGARLAVQKTVIPGVSAPVRGVRIGQYRPDVARVVIDLTAATPYQLSPRRRRSRDLFRCTAGRTRRCPSERRYSDIREQTIASGISLYRCVAPAVGAPHFQEFANFRSSLRVAQRTDPALIRSSIVQREEGTCSSDGSANQASQKAVQQGRRRPPQRSPPRLRSRSLQPRVQRLRWRPPDTLGNRSPLT